MTPLHKDALKRQAATCLASAPEVRRVVVFGSFLTSDTPRDMDIAVFQDSDEPYLPLALRYRRLARPLSRQIPLDIIPVRENASGPLLQEINQGEVVFER